MTDDETTTDHWDGLQTASESILRFTGYSRRVVKASGAKTTPVPLSEVPASALWLMGFSDSSLQ